MESGAEYPAVEVVVAARTDPGRKRTENQDSFLVADLSVGAGDGGMLLHPDDAQGVASGQIRLGNRGLLAAVADGMGGAAGGHVASRLAVAWLYRELVARWSAAPDDEVADPLAVHLRASVEAANGHVHEQGQRNPQYAGMGSTMTAGVLLDRTLYVAQVGDSRAYLVRSGIANRLTRDQSLVQHLVESGAMTVEEAARSPHGSVLLQALGTAAAVRVEVTWQEICRGDLLLLCSDGLFRVVEDAEIAAAATGDDPAELCSQLVELANARGGPDNVTVVAARMDGDALPWPDSGEAVAVQTLAMPET
jgi:serine/threonine protein phosphatase PrpC